jgi:hypothetical protein
MAIPRARRAHEDATDSRRQGLENPYGNISQHAQFAVSNGEGSGASNGAPIVEEAETQRRRAMCKYLIAHPKAGRRREATASTAENGAPIYSSLACKAEIHRIGRIVSGHGGTATGIAGEIYCSTGK